MHARKLHACTNAQTYVTHACMQECRNAPTHACTHRTHRIHIWLLWWLGTYLWPQSHSQTVAVCTQKDQGAVSGQVFKKSIFVRLWQAIKIAPRHDRMVLFLSVPSTTLSHWPRSPPPAYPTGLGPPASLATGLLVPYASLATGLLVPSASQATGLLVPSVQPSPLPFARGLLHRFEFRTRCAIVCYPATRSESASPSGSMVPPPPPLSPHTPHTHTHTHSVVG